MFGGATQGSALGYRMWPFQGQALATCHRLPLTRQGLGMKIRHWVLEGPLSRCPKAQEIANITHAPIHACPG